MAGEIATFQYDILALFVFVALLGLSRSFGKQWSIWTGSFVFGFSILMFGDKLIRMFG